MHFQTIKLSRELLNACINITRCLLCNICTLQPHTTLFGHMPSFTTPISNNMLTSRCRCLWLWRIVALCIGIVALAILHVFALVLPRLLAFATLLRLLLLQCIQIHGCITSGTHVLWNIGLALLLLLFIIIIITFVRPLLHCITIVTMQSRIHCLSHLFGFSKKSGAMYGKMHADHGFKATNK